MRVSLTSTGALERRLEVAVPSADVDKVYADRLKAFGRTARLKGFRPGKAPAKVVEQQFGGQIRQEVVSEVLQNSLNQALAQGGIFPVGNPRIEPLSLAPGQDQHLGCLGNCVWGHRPILFRGRSVCRCYRRLRHGLQPSPTCAEPACGSAAG